MDQFELNENIINRLSLQKLPYEKRVKMLEQITDMIIKRVTLKLMENLPETDVAAANELVDKPEELVAFLSSKVDNMGALLDNEITAVKQELFVSVAVPEIK
jgi:hypothetical protein